MKQEYERAVLSITAFDCEDVITTSAPDYSPDRNNAYRELSQLDDSNYRIPISF